MEEPLIASPPSSDNKTQEIKKWCPNDTSIRRKPEILEVANGGVDTNDYDDVDVDDDDHDDWKQDIFKRNGDSFLLYYLLVILLFNTAISLRLISAVEMGEKERRFLIAAYTLAQYSSMVLYLCWGWRQWKFCIALVAVTLGSIILFFFAPLLPIDSKVIFLSWSWQREKWRIAFAMISFSLICIIVPFAPLALAQYYVCIERMAIFAMVYYTL